MSEDKYIWGELPTDSKSVEGWVDKFVKLRLQGLRSDPDSFVASYSNESKRSIEDWIAILTKPAFTVVACATKDESKSANLQEREWVGQTLCYGPQFRARGAEYDVAWFVSGVYVVPAHRKNNVTTLLVEGSVQLKMRSDTTFVTQDSTVVQRGPTTLIFEGLASPGKPALARYYEKGVRFMMTDRMVTRRSHCDKWGISYDENMDDQERILIERREEPASAQAARARL